MKQINDIKHYAEYMDVRNSSIVREKIVNIMISDVHNDGRTSAYEAEIWLMISEYKGENKPNWAHTGKEDTKHNEFLVEVRINKDQQATHFKSLYGTYKYLFIFEHMKEALDFYMNLIDEHHVLVWDDGFTLVDSGIDEKIMEEYTMDKQSATSIVLDYLSEYTKEEIKEMVAKNFIPFLQSLTGMSEHDVLIKLDSEVYSKLYNFWKHFKIKCHETDAGKKFISEFFSYIFDSYFGLDEDNVIKFKDDISYDDMKEAKLGKLYSNVKERHNNDETNLDMLLNMFYHKMKEFGDIKVIKKYFAKCKSIVSDVFGDITYHSDVYNHNRDEEIKYLSNEYI